MLVPAPASVANIVFHLAQHGHDAKDLTSCLLTYLSKNPVPDTQDELHDSHQAHTYRETIREFSELLIQEMDDDDREAFGQMIDEL